MPKEISEKDWQLFRGKVPVWQDAYIDKLNQEYIEIFNSYSHFNIVFLTKPPCSFLGNKAVLLFGDMKRKDYRSFSKDKISPVSAWMSYSYSVKPTRNSIS